MKKNTKNDYVVNIEKSVERPRDQMITGKWKCDYTLPNDTDDGLALSDNLIGTSYPDTNTAPEEAAYPVKTAALRMPAARGSDLD